MDKEARERLIEQLKQKVTVARYSQKKCLKSIEQSQDVKTIEELTRLLNNAAELEIKCVELLGKTQNQWKRYLENEKQDSND